ncbi:MAG TPA: hypothetical protein VHQ46_00905 [Desulfobacteria bacterium]|nr:hypothetical protein [Desulfobacteria bacterium]
MADDCRQKGGIISVQTGSATLFCLVTVLVMLLLSTTYVSLAQAERRMTTRNIQARQALYLAEAGVELARSNLGLSTGWTPQASYALETGTFKLTITTTMDSGYIVLSEGDAGNAKRKIKVTLVPSDNPKWKIVSYQEDYSQ